MKTISLIFLLILTTFLKEAKAVVDSPQIHCISVAPNGDITLTWTTPPDPLIEFISYSVYSSPNHNGPYSLDTTITTYGLTSMTDYGAGGNISPKFYYIKTNSAGGVSSPAKDTLVSMFLTVSNPLNGTALLNWNAISVPLPASSSGIYSIFREYPVGVWKLIGSTSGLSFIDTISICHVHLNYKIVLNDASGCSSVSNISGGNFVDGIPPNKPVIDSVSINAAGQAIIGLVPSSSGDAVAYVIYIHNGASVVAIDTVHGNVFTMYTNINSSAGAGAETYDIASIDSCGNICTHGLAQNTIFVSAKYNICQKIATVNWNAYINMTGGVKEYQVLVSVNGAPFTLLGKTTNLTFTDTGLIRNNTYCYKIRAWNLTGKISSTSNKVCVIAKAQTEPTYVYVKKVTVNQAQFIDIEYALDNKAGILGMNVFVSENNAGPYSLLAYMPFTGAATYAVSDNNVNTAAKNYYYYVQIIDSCNLTGIKSNTSKSILLNVKADKYFTNTLVWDDYSFFSGNVISYNIYRSVDGVFNPAPVGNVPFGTLSYIDDVSAFTPNQGKFGYYVEAVEGAGDTYGFMETSTSNIVNVYQEADVFIPNAFSPHGENKIFLPVTQYVEKTDYKLMIFNRFGNKIWETESDLQGWDGSNCEGGVYVYLIQYKSAIGEFKNFKGTVTLLR